MPQRGPQGGFTLIELLVTVSLAGILFGFAAPALSGWSESTAQKGARDEVVSALRNVAQRSLSEGRTYCVHFTSGSNWQTYRRSCSGPTAQLVGAGQGLGNARQSLTPSFVYNAGLASACPQPGRCAYFYPRGTASAGTVTVTRAGQPTYTVNVEQLTSRVYSN